MSQMRPNAGGAKGVIARNSCLSGFGGEHPFPRTTSCHCVPVLLTHSLTSTCPCGPHRLVHHLILCQETSHSGTDLVFWLTVHLSSPHLLSRHRQRDSWLRRRHTVVTGFLLCLLLTVAYASTWGSASSCRYEAGAQFVCFTQLSLRDPSGCPRSPRHGLQEGTGQNRKTPCS